MQERHERNQSAWSSLAGLDSVTGGSGETAQRDEVQLLAVVVDV